MQKSAVLAIDQGTTSTRSVVFNSSFDVIALSQQSFKQHFSHDAWVEHSPDDIWQTTRETFHKAYDTATANGYMVEAVGITNQRETTVVWNRSTGEPIYNAIVWQDRRTSEFCTALKQAGHESMVRNKTGLLLDPYFSASKIRWILDNVTGARELACKGELAFGTIDCFLVHRLTNGKVHAIDPTNASRTALYNIHSGQWDSELLDLFDIPASMLPTVLNSVDNYGYISADICANKLPIVGIAGDQQAAAIGQRCFAKGDTKSTYGTGCFILSNIGNTATQLTVEQPSNASNNNQGVFLQTIAYQIDNIPTYAIEGSIFNAGSAVQWLRDAMGIITDVKDTSEIASRLSGNDGVYLVPAFTGLGAPWWDPHARGSITGLTRDTGADHMVRACLESIAYQTWDLLNSMNPNNIDNNTLKVDGGMAANDWLMQFIADVLNTKVVRPAQLESTALGAAYLAGLGANWYSSLSDINTLTSTETHFLPSITNEQRQQCLLEWHQAVQRVINTK